MILLFSLQKELKLGKLKLAFGLKYSILEKKKANKKAKSLLNLQLSMKKGTF